jgi:ribonucleoside-diphosphate reductase alpha chain
VADEVYRYADAVGAERSITETWRRIAHALAAVEPEDAGLWEKRFFGILQDFSFLPGGRIQAGAGTARHVTLFNCFVMGAVEDSMPGIFRALHESAITMQQGGGIGVDFSTIRPRGTRAKGAGNIASGPVSFMHIWNAMCGTILSTGARRGAMMATVRCDHPDIEEFIAAKQQPGQLRRFNLSVLLTDAFMAVVRSDAEWPLI